jgi:AraC family transcriptional regulator
MLRALDGHPLTNARPVRTADYSLEIQCCGPATLQAVYRGFHLVTVALSGTPLVIRRNGTASSAVRLAPGESSLHPAGPGGRVVWPEGMHALQIHLHPRMIRRSSPASGTGPLPGLAVQAGLRDPAIRSIGLELRSLVHRPGSMDGTGVRDLLQQLAEHLISRYSAPAAPEPRLGHRSLEEVLDRIRDAPTRVEAIATWCGLSRAHFSRRFVAVTGISPQTMLLGSRIEAAKHLLERGAASLGEVAYATGFADQSHLTRTIRQATGLTPARYRACATQRPA